jgi:hypothetical protein
MAIMFDGKPGYREPDYRRWLEHHEGGYILNVGRVPSADYLMLHRATCRYISHFEQQEPGAFTDRDYCKVCADTIDDLKNWIRQHVGRSAGFTAHRCPCHPPFQG